MVVLDPGRLTLPDVIKRQTEYGDIADFANLLSQVNGMDADMPHVESTSHWSDQSTIVTKLPTTGLRALNQGVTSTKGATEQSTESLCIMEAWSEVDKAIADAGGNARALRASEAGLMVEAMAQDFHRYMIYGDRTVDAKQINGFAVRTNDRSTAAPNRSHVIDAGGTVGDTGALTSGFLVGWSPETVCGLYPKGQTMGLTRRDYGEQVSENVNAVTGAKMVVYREWFRRMTGLRVKDWRFLARVCNIKVSDFLTMGGTQSPTTFNTLMEKMIEADGAIPWRSNVKGVWYFNRAIFTGLKKLAFATNKNSGALSVTRAGEGMGNAETGIEFMGRPVRCIDQIVNTEAFVAA